MVEKEKVNVSKKNKIVDHAFHATTKNEVKFLKNKIDCLSSTLSKCAFNHSRLETLFSKKQTPYIHAHHHPHAYAHFARHDHTHTHMHSRVHKCTHYGRKGHLVKCCFDKIHHINFAKKNVWVPYNANPQGPKRKWVPKFLPFIFDVGAGSHKT